jgi:small subunit ribosomal protein S6
MPLYESTFVARQDISRADINRMIETYSEIITQGGGKVVKQEYWGLRNLAYKIKKNRKAHYVLLAIDAPYDALKEMERTLRISEDIIRVLSVRVDAIEEGPSPMMQKSGRDEESGDSPQESTPVQQSA